MGRAVAISSNRRESLLAALGSRLRQPEFEEEREKLDAEDRALQRQEDDEEKKLIAESSRLAKLCKSARLREEQETAAPCGAQESGLG